MQDAKSAYAATITVPGIVHGLPSGLHPAARRAYIIVTTERDAAFEVVAQKNPARLVIDLSCSYVEIRRLDAGLWVMSTLPALLQS